MGASGECIDQEHDACITTWCDCGCHHDLIDQHYDGAHADTPNWRCQKCMKDAQERYAAAGARLKPPE